MAALNHAHFKHRCVATPGAPGIDGLDELSGSVGEGGQNRAPDVREVQSRLNGASISDGGADPLLKEDGLCGSRTKAAILKFQKNWPDLLLKDSRIDVDKSSWKKLLLVSSENDGDVVAKGAVGAPAKKTKKKPPRDSATTQAFLTGALHLTQNRIFKAIQALDTAASELIGLEAFRTLQSALTPMTLQQAYQNKLATLAELPTVDRCFKIVNPKMTFAGVSDTLRRLRKVFTDMVDVIVATVISSPAAEASDVKRFVRTAPDAAFKAMYPPNGALANAEQGGWWKRDANKAHILYNASKLNASDIITTLLHEMSHFVSHSSSFQVGQHHAGGLYQSAFNDNHDQAVRNSFCYEWYAMFALFPSKRATPNNSQPNPV